MITFVIRFWISFVIRASSLVILPRPLPCPEPALVCLVNPLLLMKYLWLLYKNVMRNRRRSLLTVSSIAVSLFLVTTLADAAQ